MISGTTRSGRLRRRSCWPKLGFGLTDEAFTAGLIHDIGMMVEMQYDRNKLIDVLDSVKPNDDSVPTGNMMEQETEVFGVTHRTSARRCASRKFPRRSSA